MYPALAVAFLLGALVGEGLEGRQVLGVYKTLQDGPDARLLVLLGKQRRVHDEVHVALILQVQTAQVLLLLICALVLLLKLEDVL